MWPSRGLPWAGWPAECAESTMSACARTGVSTSTSVPRSKPMQVTGSRCPPMALLYQREAGPKIRGTLAAYFTVGVTLSLIGLSTVGRFGMREVVLSLQLVPGVLVGYFLSRGAARRLDRGYIRKAVLVLSAAAAVGVIVRHL